MSVYIFNLQLCLTTSSLEAEGRYESLPQQNSDTAGLEDLEGIHLGKEAGCRINSLSVPQNMTAAVSASGGLVFLALTHG